MVFYLANAQNNYLFIVVVDCGKLTELDHGTVVLKDQRTTHGAKAIYTCHENYTLIGKYYIKQKPIETR